MEQLVILLVIAAVSLIKWLMEKSAESRAAKDTARRIDDLQRNGPAAPPDRAPRPVATPLPDLDEAARRLREALGLPDDAEPPRPVAPRPRPRPAIPPPVPEWAPAPSRPVILFQRPLLEPTSDLERRTIEGPPAPVFVSPAPVPVRPVAASSPAPRTPIEELLHSREGLRKAILAQEILGTPKGLVF